jgi:hypothetical protein
MNDRNLDNDRGARRRELAHLEEAGGGSGCPGLPGYVQKNYFNAFAEYVISLP